MSETGAAVQESPAAKVKCYGAGVQPSAVHKGQKAVFTVDATQATVTGAPVSVTTTNLSTGRYSHFILLCQCHHHQPQHRSVFTFRSVVSVSPPPTSAPVGIHISHQPQHRSLFTFRSVVSVSPPTTSAPVGIHISVCCTTVLM